jgi:hypothetical protein
MAVGIMVAFCTIWKPGTRLVSKGFFLVIRSPLHISYIGFLSLGLVCRRKGIRRLPIKDPVNSWRWRPKCSLEREDGQRHG